MKNTYETIIIIADKLTEEEYKKTLNKYKNKLKRLDATIVKIDTLGKKKLAYEIKDCKEGYYIVFTYKVEAEKIMALEKSIRINSDIIKFLTVRVEDDDLDEYAKVPDERVDEIAKSPAEILADVESEQISRTPDAWDLIFSDTNLTFN